ncbi:hypothetical protein EV421DRAFT_1908377 [Armillaria borealis]|uniref:Uncharacterized protein n=1 Tax=Armillaria borealis TaxID=47425 RepID=A0AA39MJM8_9AGAR|nr:hypothetical protein EV421DRAFT_1908377 [Armillaria borealis]
MSCRIANGLVTDQGPLTSSRFEFILTRRYTLTHLFADKQYEHFSQLGPQFKATLFSCPLGLDQHPIYNWFVRTLDAFWVQWPIEDDPLLFEPEFEEEKTWRSKEIMSLFMMGLEERWSNPTLRPEGDAGSVECMFILMWYLHDVIDNLFLSLKEDPPTKANLQDTLGINLTAVVLTQSVWHTTAKMLFPTVCKPKMLSAPV